MMRRAVRRGLSLLLALCLAMGLAPAAFAADATGAAKEVIRTANDHNNFDYDQYAGGTIQLNASAEGGIVRYTFQRPADARAGSLYAAVLPTDASGNPGSHTWQDVRYVRLSESGGAATLSYFRQGCRHFAVMLVQPLPDGGEAGLEVTAVNGAPVGQGIRYHVKDDANANYVLSFRATLTMSLDMAQLTDAAQSDPEMKDLTFTSHIRFNPALGSVAVSGLTLDSGIFQIVSQAPAAGEAGVDVTCALRSDWTETEGWTSLVDKLQKEMTFTGTVTLTGAQIRTLADAGQSALYAVGWNTIGNIPGRVLGGSQVQVPAALLELPVAVADDLVVDVVDPSNNNAPVPGARVTLTLVTNDAQHSYGPLTTDANGQVTFTNIPYGTYRVDVVYSHASTDPPHDHYATRTGIFRAGVEEAVVELRLNTQVEVNTKVNAADVLEPGETAQSASADNLQNAVVWPESTEGERHQIEVDLKVVQVPVAAGTPEAAAAQEIVANFGADTSIPADPGQVTGSPLIMTDFVDATITATTTVTDMATGAQTSQSTQSVKNTVQLVDVFIPVPDNLLALLERFGLTTDYIRVYRNHQPEDQQAAPELTELTRITENNRTREGFYTVTLTDQGESRSYVVIRAQKFSVYAFGVVLHSEPVAPVAPVEPGQGGGTGGGVTRYPVETESGGRGSASASHDRAPAGTKVTITVTPDEGYRLNTIVVTDSAGNRITVTANADGTFTFTMPARGVTVEASFTLDIADPDETGVSGWLETGEHMAYMVGDDRGDFRPDANITRAEVVQMFYRLLRDQDVPVAGTFSDVEEDAWYARAVNVLASLGMVNGVGGNQFAPERAITRAEFAAIAARFARAHNIGITFTDVPESHWAWYEIGEATTGHDYTMGTDMETWTVR